MQMSSAVGIKTRIINKSHTSKKVLNRPVKRWNSKFFIAVEDTARPESSFLKCGSRKAAKSELWKDSEGEQ